MDLWTLFPSSSWVVIEIAAQSWCLLKPGQDEKFTQHSQLQALEQNLLDAPKRGRALGFGVGTPRGKVQDSSESSPRAARQRAALSTGRSGRARDLWREARPSEAGS